VKSTVFRGILLALLAVLFVGFSAPRARADVCVTIDEGRDMFSPQERTAALLLLSRQFELAGERVVAAPCPSPYVVSHVQLGTLIMISLSGPDGERDATASSLNDLPAVYSQMIRSLLKGVPMNAAGVVDRTNVSEAQARSPRRVSSDSLFYARLGYGAMFGDRTYGGPSVGLIGYRRELDTFGVDVSFFNIQYMASTSSYGYAPSRSNGTTGSWLKLAFLRFTAPLADRSPYFGGGLSLTSANLNNDNKSWSGSGLQGELTVGYELGRASNIRVFVQADTGLPFYHVKSNAYTYIPTPPYFVSTAPESRYVPTVALSLGVGWQRGGGRHESSKAAPNE
jgi:hypothetical protein